jgi:dipeptidyl aminopeptidase/acylaminoacyl peptidase
MKRIVVFGLLGVLALVAGCQTGEETKEVARYAIEDFLGNTNYVGASFSPDKSKVLVSSDATGVYNAYAIPLDGGDPVQLTESTTEAVIVRSYFPADERLLYSSDQGGNELNHLYVRETDGSVTDLTPGDKHTTRFLGWADDDASFFVATNERNPRFFDVYEYAVDDYERTMIFRNDEGYMAQAISPDKRYVVLGKVRTTYDTDLYLHDRETGEMTHLTPHEGDATYSAEEFTLDGSKLLMLTDEDSEFTYLVSHDLASGERKVLVRPEWDVSSAGLSKNGKYLVVRINNDARTEIVVHDAATMAKVDLPELPQAEISSTKISDDEKTIAFYVSSSRSPRDLYVYEIGEAAPRSLTRSMNPNIDVDDMVEAEVVRFNSYDEVEIPGVLYKPHQASPDNRAPALVWVHGGPGGQSRVGYSGLLQYLVNHGYVVYAINNRGSSGYGKTFYMMDDRKHGEADLGDCVASKQMLIDTGYVDPDRIGIIGGSYGGYMVLAALAFTPEEFTVGVDIFGVANWVRTLESIPAWWEAQREALYKELGHPVEDAERLHRISPVFHSGNIVKPLMVLQGANDPRVLQIESDEMVEAARANGAPVEYMIFDDEGHGFRKKKNQERGYRAILDFLDRHLKGETEEAEAAA